MSIAKYWQSFVQDLAGHHSGGLSKMSLARDDDGSRMRKLPLSQGKEHEVAANGRAEWPEIADSHA